jgi:hypothetical protein
VLLQTVPVRHHRLQTSMVGNADIDNDPTTHPSKLAREQAPSESANGDFRQILWSRATCYSLTGRLARPAQIVNPMIASVH